MALKEALKSRAQRRAAPPAEPMPLPPTALIWRSCLGVMFFEDPIAAFAKCAPGDEAGGTGGARGVPRASGKPVAKRIARSGYVLGADISEQSGPTCTASARTVVPA